MSAERKPYTVKGSSCCSPPRTVWLTAAEAAPGLIRGVLKPVKTHINTAVLPPVQPAQSKKP